MFGENEKWSFYFKHLVYPISVWQQQLKSHCEGLEHPWKTGGGDPTPASPAPRPERQETDTVLRQIS